MRIAGIRSHHFWSRASFTSFDRNATGGWREMSEGVCFAASMADQLSSDLASLRINREEDRPPRSKAWVGIAAGVIVLLAIGAFAYSRISNRVFKAEVAVTEIRLLSPAQSQVQLSASGYVIARKTSRVGTRLMGRIAKVEVREGDVVKEGDVLVRLDDAAQRSAVASARARVAAAKARAQTARATLAETAGQLAREKRLAAGGASTPAAVEDLELKAKALEESVKAADAETEAAEAELRALQVDLDNTVIAAPIAGRVMGKPVEVGETVSPGDQPVLEIADFATLQVEVDVPEGRLGKVKVEGPCEIILDAFSDRRYRCRVAELSPRVNRAKATVGVKVAFQDAAEGVLPDMAARVNFLSGELDAESLKEPPKLYVPAAAVVQRAGQDVVFRIESDGRVRMTPVELGAAMANGFELKRGPSDGTKVVSAPPSTMFDGQQVKERT